MKTMKREEISNKIKEIIIEVMELEITTEEINGVDLINELGINSIDAMEILVTVESEFDIEIEDEALNSDLINSLDHLVQYSLSRMVV